MGHNAEKIGNIIRRFSSAYVAEVVARVGPLAQRSFELVRVTAVQLENLSAVQAELVRGGGDAAADVRFTGLR